MKFYDFYLKNKKIGSYNARNKKAAVLMAKGDRLIYDRIVITNG